jgi:GTPase SAR1 family protein
MATITLHQTRTNELDGTYKVVNTLLNNVGIPVELFVLDSTTAAFSHVANVFEITELPTEDTIGYPKYRSATTTEIFTNVGEAVVFAGDLKRRIDLLIEEYTTEVDAFPGEEDTDFPLA